MILLFSAFTFPGMLISTSSPAGYIVFSLCLYVSLSFLYGFHFFRFWPYDSFWTYQDSCWITWKESLLYLLYSTLLYCIYIGLYFFFVKDIIHAQAPNAIYMNNKSLVPLSRSLCLTDYNTYSQLQSCRIRVELTFFHLKSCSAFYILDLN